MKKNPLPDLDLAAFWDEDRLAHEDDCFSPTARQVALGIRMNETCVFSELGEPGNPLVPIPRERVRDLVRRYNDEAERIVGLRLLPESFSPDDARLPPVRNLVEVFGSRVLDNGVAEWVQPSCGTPRELERLLDRVDRLDLREFLLPPGWASETRRVFERTGEKPGILCSIRGPVTMAMSVYGVENLIYLLVDEPELGERFSRTILRVVRDAMDLFDAEAGVTRETRPHGFYFYDDDCCLLTPELYEAFASPILSGIFEHASPDPGDDRYQHSDSAMGHLLPQLARLGLTSCNFGPTLSIDEIRHHLPRARIDGQLAPFTFQSNDEERIVAEVRRDCEAARRCGRGVNLETAGSVNDGTRLTSLRVVMAAIQEYGRY